jgi:hypothetical protein
MIDYHDAEILSLESNRESGILKIAFLLCNNEKLLAIFTGVIHWEFSPFEMQNVVYEVEFYDVSKVPVWLREEYNNLNDFIKSDLNVAFINPATGLGGIIIYKNLTIENL